MRKRRERVAAEPLTLGTVFAVASRLGCEPDVYLSGRVHVPALDSRSDARSLLAALLSDDLAARIAWGAPAPVLAIARRVYLDWLQLVQEELAEADRVAGRLWEEARLPRPSGKGGGPWRTALAAMPFAEREALKGMPLGEALIEISATHIGTVQRQIGDMMHRGEA